MRVTSLPIKMASLFKRDLLSGMPARRQAGCQSIHFKFLDDDDVDDDCRVTRATLDSEQEIRDSLPGRYSPRLPRRLLHTQPLSALKR